MRIKLDENIAASAADRLTALGHDVHTVIQEQLSGHVDSEVWGAAQSEGRFLITQDLDFSDQRRFAAGRHAGVLLVRLPDAEQWRISDYIVAWFSTPGARAAGYSVTDEGLVQSEPSRLRARRLESLASGSMRRRCVPPPEKARAYTRRSSREDVPGSHPGAGST